jgi:hypothetical protein
MLQNKLLGGLLLTGLSLILMATVSGCGQNQPEPEEYTINDFYPFTENVTMVYEGQGNEFASYTTYVDYINEDVIQIRTNNGGTEFATVLQNSEGALTQVYSVNEMYYKADLTDKSEPSTEVLLKEPLEVGTKWSLSDGRQREITSLDMAVETPYDNFEALEVTTTKNGTVVEKQYYAMDIGLVKSIFMMEGDEISSSLKELITGAGYDFTVRSFNFIVTDTDIESTFEDKTVTLKTGEGIKDFMSTEFLEGGLMSENTVVNDMWLDPGSDVANVDFSKEFVTEMNAGTTKESGVLMSVANTIGYYYQVQKVIITLDGEPYSSGHILMKEGESFDTTYQNDTED